MKLVKPIYSISLFTLIAISCKKENQKVPEQYPAYPIPYLNDETMLYWIDELYAKGFDGNWYNQTLGKNAKFVFFDSTSGYAEESCYSCIPFHLVQIELATKTVTFNYLKFQREVFAPNREYWVSDKQRYTVTLGNESLRAPLIYAVDSIVSFPPHRVDIKAPAGQIVLVTNNLDQGYFDILDWTEIIRDFNLTADSIFFYNKSKGYQVNLKREFRTDGSEKWIEFDGSNYYIVRRNN